MESGNLFRILDLLRRHEIPFVVIGGHAVIHHGFVRATEDVDILFIRTIDSEVKLLNALDEIHASWISDEIDPSTGLEKTVPVTMSFVQATHLMMLVTDLGYLDIFDFIPGYSQAEVRELFDQSIQTENARFVSLPWLRRMKIAAGRPQDQLDLANLPQ